MPKEYVISTLRTPYLNYVLCPRCKGTGKVPMKQTIEDSRYAVGRTVIVQATCPVCNGTGYVYTGNVAYRTSVFGGGSYKPRPFSVKQPPSKKLGIDLLTRRKAAQRAF